MRKLLPLVAALALLATACSPNADTTNNTDSNVGSDAAAADTAGAARMMAQDKAGVRMDSAGTHDPQGLTGTSSTGDAGATSAPSSGAGATSAQGQ